MSYDFRLRRKRGTTIDYKKFKKEIDELNPLGSLEMFYSNENDVDFTKLNYFDEIQNDKIIKAEYKKFIKYKKSRKIFESILNITKTNPDLVTEFFEIYKDGCYGSLDVLTIFTHQSNKGEFEKAIKQLKLIAQKYDLFLYNCQTGRYIDVFE